MTASTRPYLPPLKPMAAVLALALAGGHSAVQALTLGSAEIRSSVGEPLAVEIDLPGITDEEAKTLRVGLASSQTYSSLGLQLSSMLQDLRITVKRRTDGRSYVELRSERPIVEPYVELVLQARWATGQLQKEYTLLVDPPKVPAAGAERETMAISVTAPGVEEAAPAVTAAALSSGVDRPSVRVAPGDTASAIASRWSSAGVSLDQMLVAMVKANPHAFVQGNVNRLKAGAVLDLPDAAQASQTNAAEARRLVLAQIQEFNAFRQQIANSASAAPAEGKAREIQGQVQTGNQQLPDRLEAADKLTLSHGERKQASPEEELIRQRAAQAIETQAQEATRNLDDLKQLQADIGTAVNAASKPIEQAAQTAGPPATGTVTTLPTVLPPPSGPTQPSWVEQISSHAWLLPIAGGLLALLALWGTISARRNKVKPSSAQERASVIPPTTVTGIGQNDRSGVDNAERPARHVSVLDSSAADDSSMSSQSRLDEGEELDPIAEADVYLAYGKDEQAEHILREAIGTPGAPLSVRMKLLEVLAKRRNLSAFEEHAGDVYRLTQGRGSDWNTVATWGRSLDPLHAMYQDKTGATSPPLLDPENPQPWSDTKNARSSEAPHHRHDAKDPVSVFDALDIDLNLDFDLDGHSAPPTYRPIEPVTASGYRWPVVDPAMDKSFDELDLDLEPTPARASEDSVQKKSGLPSTDGRLAATMTLARQQFSLGNVAVARAMAQEVVEQGEGALQVEAKTFLATMN